MDSSPAVSRETLEELAERFRLPPGATDQLARLLAALAADEHAPTAIRDPDAAIEVHIADSLVGLEVEQLGRARRVADVGAGAGFPGLPLAVALPGATVDLVEAVARKGSSAAALIDAAQVLNARVVTARAEAWAAGEGRGAYDAVTARAVAPLAVLVEYAAPLLRTGGALVAWKGARDPDEEEAGRRAAALVGLEPRLVMPVRPFAASRNRHLHVYLKVSETPPRFPRRPGAAAKRPLGE